MSFPLSAWYLFVSIREPREIEVVRKRPKMFRRRSVFLVTDDFLAETIALASVRLN